MSRLKYLSVCGQLGLAGVAAVAAAAFLYPVSAHDERTPVHFVAEHGVDQGDCSAAERPCVTIGYALRKAGKGDEIRVGTGVFKVRPLWGRIELFLSSHSASF